MPEPRRREPPLFIGIAGGSGAGKTTIAAAVFDGLHQQVAIVEHDAYYHHRPELSFEERTKINYDHPDSLETELLVRHLNQLRSGNAIEKPVYDFADHIRSDETIRVEPARVVVVEGILVLAEDALRDELDVKVFVDTDADIRLARRLQRDIEDRGRSMESVLAQYFATVRPMHLEFVEPSKRHADLVISGGSDPPIIGTVLGHIRSRL